MRADTVNSTVSDKSAKLHQQTNTLQAFVDANWKLLIHLHKSKNLAILPVLLRKFVHCLIDTDCISINLLR